MKTDWLSGIGLLMLLAAFMGCDTAPRAKSGDTVRVHYVGTLEDGTEFDSSRNGKPLEFTIGKPGIIEGFSQGVIGMKVGETKRITLPPEQAYQQHRPELVQVVPRSVIPPDIVPEVGLRLTAPQQNGTTIPVTITAVDDSTITIDANHPMAGKTLNFDLELVEIVPTESK